MTLISTAAHPRATDAWQDRTMAVPPSDRRALARYLDHTLLAPEATEAAVEALCHKAIELQVFAACVSPSLATVARAVLDSAGTEGPALACVCGFPSGAHKPTVKAREAELAVANGADEVDVVIDLGLAAAREWARLEDELRVVRQAVPKPLVLKVILETAALDHDGVIAGCHAAEAAGADFVKTSTGFHPSGGATVDAVSLMAATVGGRLGVKASGGIRTAEAALGMITAGATRIGTSSSEAILKGLPG
jgi:deoxyribose-phosphate aldolase